MTDAILPRTSGAVLYQQAPSGLLRGGYRRLAFAALLDAAARLAGSNPECGIRREINAKRYAREARQWFEASGDAETPFTFEWICEGLGIPPGPTRRAALAGKLTALALARGT